MTPPRTRQTSSIAQHSSQVDGVGFLEELPQTAAAVIYECLDARSRTSLASVSRWARDLVFREARSVELQLHSTAPRKPLVSFLNRVCCAAQAGRLSLSMKAHGFAINRKSNVLSDLLAPAKQQGGWASVKELAIKDFPGSSKPVLKPVSTAFPFLQSISLSRMSFKRADLGSLSACSQLMQLDLHSCQLHPTQPDSIPSPLSAVHSLRQLSASETDNSIAGGLTQLTGLSLRYGPGQGAECLGHITGLIQLQHLELTGAFYAPLLIQGILTSCKQLTSLALHWVIYQVDLDALLAHGTHLTSFTCSSLYIQEDRSASPCSWKELVMTRQGFDGETLACIPTGSLTRLVFEDKVFGAVFPSPTPVLDFTPSDFLVPDNMPEDVHRSLVNLIKCPAWQQCGPGVHVHLRCTDLDEDEGMPELLSLIPALAPLAGKEVKLCIDMPDAAFEASEVQELGVTLGSSLKQLMVKQCFLSPDFWPSVWAHLPGLQQLGVGDSVYGAVSVHDFTPFCSRATRPLQLSLGQERYKEIGQLLQKYCSVWGVPHVTIDATTLEPPAP